MPEKRNEFNIVAERIVADIANMVEGLEGKGVTPFGKTPMTPDEAADAYLRKTPEARQTFQKNLSTEEMLKVAQRIVAKRGQFHA